MWLAMADVSSNTDCRRILGAKEASLASLPPRGWGCTVWLKLLPEAQRREPASRFAWISKRYLANVL